MRFTKMQGLGNDYVYLDCTKETPPDLPGLAVKVSDRHFGIGADGLICICPSGTADFRMRMFNADGSEGAMCGNGIRCVGKFVYDKRMTSKKRLSIETASGVKGLDLHTEDGKVAEVTVDMGIPEPDQSRIITVYDKDYRITPVSMGNPHAVLCVRELEELDLTRLGPGFERHPSFPGRTNTEFVEVCAPDRLRVRVWERGSGETLACGTGACAALVASVLNGLCGREARVELPGGTLHIRWEERDGHVYMTGPAVTVYEGVYDHGSDQ